MGFEATENIVLSTTKVKFLYLLQSLQDLISVMFLPKKTKIRDFKTLYISLRVDLQSVQIKIRRHRIGTHEKNLTVYQTYQCRISSIPIVCQI